MISYERNEEKEKIKERVRRALSKTRELIVGGKSYLESQLMQRIEGPNNAGSSYEDMTPAELLQKLYDAEWQEVQVDGVMPGCTALKAPIEGLNGILDIENLPEETEFYAIDPKGTGKIGIGAAGIQKRPEQETYLILGDEEGVGEVVFTFHPGKPVSPSMVESKYCPHGSKLSREEVMALGFSKAKFLSDEMKKEFDNPTPEQLKEREEAAKLRQIVLFKKVHDEADSGIEI